MTEAKTKKPAAKSAPAEKPAAKGRYIEAVGKRKTASARVRLFDGGKGSITVNDLPMNDYFRAPLAQMIVNEPLEAAAMKDKFDITVKVFGGGKKGQAEAVRHGIARTLLAFDKELRALLKSNGWLTRDAREKERKKPGLKKARRAPQWSKR